MRKKLIASLIIIKLCIFGIIIIAYYTLPFNQLAYESIPHFPHNEPITLQTAFKTWDAQHYLHLSQVWYKPNQSSNAFFPLFPFLIRLFTPLTLSPLYAGLLVSNILSLIGIYVFYLFAMDYFKKNLNLTIKSIFLLLIFPTSFYLSLVYSESLCFFLTISFFYFLYKNKFMYAAIFAFLLPLSRPVGILIVFPYTYYIFHYLYSHSPEKTWKQKMKAVLTNKRFYLLATPVLGLAAYFVTIYTATSSLSSGYNAITLYPAGWKLSHITHPEIFFSNLFAPIHANHSMINSGLDRMFFIFFLPLLFLIYKKLDKTLFIYSAAFGLVPLFGSFTSYVRYELLVFPIFMVGGILLSTKGYTLSKLLILACLFLFQITLLIGHILNYWIS